MTGAQPPGPPRRLKTWSSLGQLGRIPSEYEVVTHALNYTTRPNRTSALESNPTTAANMWFLTYRDKSPLQADDWRGFRDPDQITYRTYVTMQDEQETVVEGSPGRVRPGRARCLAARAVGGVPRDLVHAHPVPGARAADVHRLPGVHGTRVLHLQLRRVRSRGPAAPGVAGGLPDAAARRRDRLIHRPYRTGRVGAERGLAAGQGSGGETADRLRLGRVLHRHEPGPAAHAGPHPAPAARERGPGQRTTT